MKFCNSCFSLLTPYTTTGELLFTCNHCGEKRHSDPTDTLMYSEKIVTENSDLKFEHFIRNAPFDSANPKVKKECPQCKNNNTVYIRVGDDMKQIYVCSCGVTF